MVAFIDDHRRRLSGSSRSAACCRSPRLRIFAARPQQRDPTRRSARAQRDDVLRAIIRASGPSTDQVYGPRKVWKQMGREGLREARCRVRRLMREMGLAGAVRGRAWMTTTEAGPAPERPRRSGRSHSSPRRAPISSGSSDFTYVATWRGLRLRRVCHRRLRAPHRRLARLLVAGDRLRPRCARASDLRPLRAGSLAASSITAIGARSICRCATRERLADAGIEPSVGQPRRFVRQRPRRIGDRALQDGGDSTQRPVAASRGRRIRDARLGGLVQSSPAARAHRLRAAGGIRGALL